jgi:hypothetical protein
MRADDNPFKKGRIRKESPFDKEWTGIVESELMSKASQQRDRIFASNSSLCPRQTAAMLHIPDGRTTTRKASAQFYFKTGSGFEDVMARAFDSAGIMVDRETRVEMKDPLPISVSGRVDFVLKDKDEDLVLVELKTCGGLPPKVKPPHLAQLMTYLAVTGMRRGLVWYVSRNVSDYSGWLKQVTFEVTPTEEQIRDTLTKLATGAVYGGQGFLPPIPDYMKKYKCGFCPFVPMCWKEEDFELEIVAPSAADELRMTAEVEEIVNEMMSQQNELRDMFLEAMSFGF